MRARIWTWQTTVRESVRILAEELVRVAAIALYNLKTSSLKIGRDKSRPGPENSLHHCICYFPSLMIVRNLLTTIEHEQARLVDAESPNKI